MRNTLIARSNFDRAITDRPIFFYSGSSLFMCACSAIVSIQIINETSSGVFSLVILMIEQLVLRQHKAKKMFFGGFSFLNFFRARNTILNIYIEVLFIDYSKIINLKVRCFTQ